MDLQVKYNLKSPGVKRLMREAAELSHPTEEYSAKPLDDNLFEWHFTVRGPLGTEFEGGVYHGRILLPTQYPMHPPNIILLTPNGRFETNKKICLSISGHHPESWQPSWSIRTALLALIAFMPTPPGGTIGSLDYSPEERQILAKKSQSWQCPACGKISEHLAQPGHKLGNKPLTEEETSLIQQIALKAEEDALKQKPPEQSGNDVTLSTLQLNSNIERQSGDQIQPTVETATTVSPTMQTRMLPNDKVWNYAVWVILIAIGLLVFRRIFLL